MLGSIVSCFARMYDFSQLSSPIERLAPFQVGDLLSFPGDYLVGVDGLGSVVGALATCGFLGIAHGGEGGRVRRKVG